MCNCVCAYISDYRYICTLGHGEMLLFQTCACMKYAHAYLARRTAQECRNRTVVQHTCSTMSTYVAQTPNEYNNKTQRFNILDTFHIVIQG
mmetsp:Transcript_34779/g.56149  ORF Transcript_34779/g.56149 Transcript_34779/m.56149 type:complete len:91 (+) Transcript_34779:840-1112(+)